MGSQGRRRIAEWEPREVLETENRVLDFEIKPLGSTFAAPD